MSRFLDSAGLATLWGKIKDEFVAKTDASYYFNEIHTTPSSMRSMLESGTVDENKKYLVISNVNGRNRVVAIYFGSTPQSGCELARANETLIGASSLA